MSEHRRTKGKNIRVFACTYTHIHLIRRALLSLFVTKANMGGPLWIEIYIKLTFSSQ